MAGYELLSKTKSKTATILVFLWQEWKQRPEIPQELIDKREREPISNKVAMASTCSCPLSTTSSLWDARPASYTE